MTFSQRSGRSSSAQPYRDVASRLAFHLNVAAFSLAFAPRLRARRRAVAASARASLTEAEHLTGLLGQLQHFGLRLSGPPADRARQRPHPHPALLDLHTPSTRLIAASLLEAVAVQVGAHRTPGGLHIAA